MFLRYLLVLISLSFFSIFNAQTDFPALKQQFIDYRKADKQDSALLIARKMNQLALQEETDTSYWYALSMRYQGNPHYSLGNIDSTLFFWEKSVELFEAYHMQSFDYLYSLDKLARITATIGDFKSSEQHYKKALEVSKKHLGENDINYFRLQNNYLIYCVINGYYEVAEPLLKELIESIKQVYGENNREYARSIANLGILYHRIGDFKSALPFYEKALEIANNILPVTHPDYALYLNNLGVILKNLGDLKSAELYFKKALEIVINNTDSKDPNYPRFLNNLGTLYFKSGDLKSAEFYCKKATDIAEIYLNERHPDYLSYLENHANICYRLGDYKLAETEFIRVLDIKSEIFSKENPSYFISENNYATLLTKTSRENQAYEIFNKSFELKTKQIAEDFEWLSDHQKEAYWKKESSFYEDLSWFASKSYLKVPEAVALNYNSALITKSKLLETKISKENYYLEVGEIREELSYRKKLLNKLESDGSDKKEFMEKLRQEADSLDKQLELSWPAYAEQKRNLLITWDKVHQNLSEGEVAIEFVRFKEELDSTYKYQALIIRKDSVLPFLAPLCSEDELLNITSKSGFSAYYPLVWKPLEKYLKDIHTIYYAPIGELYNVPFHAIYAPQGDGDELVEAKTNKRGIVIESEHAKTEENASFLMDQYTLHQLISTRYLALGLKKKEKENIESSVTIVGGINYDYLPIYKNLKFKKTNNLKNLNDRSSTYASSKLVYLEGTKKETEAIQKKLKTNNWQVNYLEGNNAREEEVTKFTGKEGKGILHFATHGYAFPEYSSLDTTIKENSLRYSYRFNQNPMVRSGLILAGGNWAWVGSDTLSKLGAEENGILTALEVSGLNLRNTKLVVLSACETGLGKIEGSEGIFGLKRGFKLAGVEQMIVSLWSVPDKETMELMTLFYEDLVESLNPVVSFEKAQKQMRENYPTRPDLWAGFVLVR